MLTRTAISRGWARPPRTRPSRQFVVLVLLLAALSVGLVVTMPQVIGGGFAGSPASLPQTQPRSDLGGPGAGWRGRDNSAAEQAPAAVPVPSVQIPIGDPNELGFPKGIRVVLNPEAVPDAGEAVDYACPGNQECP